ncbi:MAG: 3-dehydroquinate synthase [Firmicutes bacterium HGW-Firmicutes-11]|jgi:3-dehydroquinate synthase|nr:MAG: 3-dehydroquinate synthase [Firmicutes bacterium HGW-Firmicutes-11]
MRQTLTINTNAERYTVTTETGLFFHFGSMVRELFPGKKVAVITDDTVKSIYEEHLTKQMNDAGIQWRLISFPPGEASKSFETLPKLYSQLLDFQLTRDDVVIAFGGGVVGDIAGFAAATYQRGVNLVQVPTTLMAMVDASIGGKNGANLPEGKNMAGTFYQPREVFIDPRFVRTLPDKILEDGMAEVIKYGCVFDPDLFSDLIDRAMKSDGGGIETIIFRCCLIKKQIIELDCKDEGIAMLLNFGHTFGHCIEDYFPEGTYTHGQAVSIGMYATALAGERYGFTAPNTAKLIKELTGSYGLPHSLPEGTDIEKVVEAVKRDKKRRGDKLNLVLLEKIGKGFLHQIDKADYAKFIDPHQ